MVLRMSSGYYTKTSSILATSRQYPMTPLLGFGGFFILDTLSNLDKQYKNVSKSGFCFRVISGKHPEEPCIMHKNESITPGVHIGNQISLKIVLQNLCSFKNVFFFAKSLFFTLKFSDMKFR